MVNVNSYLIIFNRRNHSMYKVSKKEAGVASQAAPESDKLTVLLDAATSELSSTSVGSIAVTDVSTAGGVTTSAVGDTSTLSESSPHQGRPVFKGITLSMGSTVTGVTSYTAPSISKSSPHQGRPVFKGITLSIGSTVTDVTSYTAPSMKTRDSASTAKSKKS
jgi:hypothetical protein